MKSNENMQIREKITEKLRNHTYQITHISLLITVK